MIVTQQDSFSNAFIAGLLPREKHIPKLDQSKDKRIELDAGIKVTIRLNEPVNLGKRGEKQYKLLLEVFSDNLLVLKTIDVSHGAGHIVIRKEYIESKEKEITTTIQKELTSHEN